MLEPTLAQRDLLVLVNHLLLVREPTVCGEVVGTSWPPHWSSNRSVRVQARCRDVYSEGRRRKACPCGGRSCATLRADNTRQSRSATACGNSCAISRFDSGHLAELSAGGVDVVAAGPAAVRDDAAVLEDAEEAAWIPAKAGGRRRS